LRAFFQICFCASELFAGNGLGFDTNIGAVPELHNFDNAPFGYVKEGFFQGLELIIPPQNISLLNKTGAVSIPLSDIPNISEVGADFFDFLPQDPELGMGPVFPH